MGTRRLIEGWERRRPSAARAKPPSRAIETKVSISSIVTRSLQLMARVTYMHWTDGARRGILSRERRRPMDIERLTAAQ